MYNDWGEWIMALVILSENRLAAASAVLRSGQQSHPCSIESCMCHTACCEVDLIICGMMHTRLRSVLQACLGGGIWRLNLGEEDRIPVNWIFAKWYYKWLKKELIMNTRGIFYSTMNQRYFLDATHFPHIQPPIHKCTNSFFPTSSIYLLQLIHFYPSLFHVSAIPFST